MPPEHQQRIGYDYASGLDSLHNKIQELHGVQQQHQGQPTALNRGLRYLKHNRSNILVLFTMYAMSTASVVAAMMAESRLQSDQLLHAQEQQQLQKELHRLEQLVQQQQQTLQSIHTHIHQHRGSWWGAGRITEQLLDKMQQWQQRGPALQVQRTQLEAQSTATPQPEREFGMRVGRLDKGFII